MLFRSKKLVVIALVLEAMSCAFSLKVIAHVLCRALPVIEELVHWHRFLSNVVRSHAEDVMD